MSLNSQFANSISDILLRGAERQGNTAERIAEIEANAKLRSGANTSGLLQQLGQIPQAIQERQQARVIQGQQDTLRQQEIDKNQGELDAQATAKRGQTLLDSVGAQFFHPETGEFDVNGMANALAQGGAAHLVPKLLADDAAHKKTLADGVKAQTEAETAQAELAGRIGQESNAILQSGGPDAAGNAAGWITGQIKRLQTKGLIPHDKAAMIVGGLDPSKPETVKATIQRMMAGAQKPETAKEPQPFTLTPGDIRFDATGKQVASVPAGVNEATPKAPPQVGTFEDYVTRTYGESPTPEQILKARKDYGQADDRQPVNVNVSGTQAPVEIKAGTPQYRTAQDLAYGRLTFPEFRTLVAYGRDPNLKMGIYSLARDLNPNFDPSQFEAGYKLYTNPQVRQRLIAIDALPPVIDKITDLATKANLSDVPAFNRALIAAKIQVGNKTVTNYRQLQTLLGDEVGNALGLGTGSDLKTKLGLNLVDATLGPEAFIQSMGQLKDVLNQRKQTILPNFGPYGASGTPVNPAVAGAPPPGARIRKIDPKTGLLEP